MATTQGPGAFTDGLYARTELFDFNCVITLANGTTLTKGGVVCLDVTQLAGNWQTTPLADYVVLPSNANAGIPFGVYQGAPITNSTGASATYKLAVVREGTCQVNAQSKVAGVAVTVGASLILDGTTDFPIAGAAALNLTIGQALATGAATAKAASIIAIPGAGSTQALVTAHVLLR